MGYAMREGSELPSVSNCTLGFSRGLSNLPRRKQDKRGFEAMNKLLLLLFISQLSVYEEPDTKIEALSTP